MPQQITLSPEHLGTLVQPNFCPRCFKIKHAINWKSPLARDVPIHGSIELLQIRRITEHVMEYGCVPRWVPDIGDVVACVTPPGGNELDFMDEASGVRVRGQPDLLLKRPNGGLVIMSFKVAQLHDDQAVPDPLNHIELNCLALCAQAQGLGEVDGLALITSSAVTPDDGQRGYGKACSGQMTAKFEVKLHWVKQDHELIQTLCREARKLLDDLELPEGRRDCQDCALLMQIHALSVRRKSNSQEAVIGYFGGRQQRQYARVGMRVFGEYY